MGLLDIVLVPGALVLAVLGLVVKAKWGELCSVLSLVCCGVLAVGSLWDINARMAVGDAAGILDIYPTMAAVQTGVLAVCAVLCIFAALRRKR